MSLEKFLQAKEALLRDENTQRLLQILNTVTAQRVLPLSVVAMLGAALDDETHVRIGIYRKGLRVFHVRPIEIPTADQNHPIISALGIHYVYPNNKAAAYLEFIAGKRFGKANVDPEHFTPSSFYSAQPLNTPQPAAGYGERR